MKERIKIECNKQYKKVLRTFHYQDVWPKGKLSREKIYAYRKLMSLGYLYNLHVDYFQLTGTTKFMYDCDDIKSDLVERLKSASEETNKQLWYKIWEVER